MAGGPKACFEPAWTTSANCWPPRPSLSPNAAPASAYSPRFCPVRRGPALVLRGKDKKNEKQRKAEDDGRRHALFRCLLLVGHPQVESVPRMRVFRAAHLARCRMARTSD